MNAATPGTPLEGGHVLVSGGSGGIGSAVCDLLAVSGFIPIVAYNKAESAASAIAARSGGLPLHLDLTSDSSIEAAIARLGAPDIGLAAVVLAAAPPLTLVPFGKISREEMLLQLESHVIGPQRLLAGVVRQYFQPKRQGCVVGILSKAMGEDGQQAMPGMGAYVIAKYGLSGVLSVLAASHKWLRVGWVKPGFTETPLLKSFDARFLTMMQEKERFQTPQEVASSIVAQILAKEDAEIPNSDATTRNGGPVNVR